MNANTRTYLHICWTAGLVLSLFSCGTQPAQETSSQPENEPVVTETTESLLPALETYLNELAAETGQLDPERKVLLDSLASYVQSKYDSGQEAQLIFICTHNSRRSHMSQLWAQAIATHHGIPVRCFSGGTEATAFNPRAVHALRTAGFDIEQGPEAENPVYRVRYTLSGEGLLAYSKKYDDPHNPSKDFAAIMTCSQADEACPFIPGAEQRVAIPYEDPKAADNTPEEEARYAERCRQIATELLYAFSQVKV